MPNIEKERWNKEEIKRAVRIMLKAETNKSILVKFLDEIVHWLILLLIVFGNVLISGFIVFISILLDKIYFYIILILFAIVFGILIEIPLRDIEKLDKHKHFLSRIMLPLLTLANVYIMIGMKNAAEYFAKNMNNNSVEVSFNFNPSAAGLVYGLFFLMPHLIGIILKKK